MDVSASTSYSSSSSGGKPDESCGDKEKSIVELSEIIIREMVSNSWLNQCRREAQIIFRVPNETLHAADKSTYQPTFLSFGPYHHGENVTEEMRRNEQGKLVGLNFIIQQGGPSVLKLTEAVVSIETDARRCYEGNVQMERDAFCKMLLLDAVQLIPLLEYLGQGQEAANPSSASAKAASTAATQRCNLKTRDMTLHDLIMLENQIPFFVVQKVYDLYYADATANGNGSVIPVDKLAWGTIKVIVFPIPPATDEGDDGVEKCKHLVHLCHVYLKPTSLAQAAAGAGNEECRDTGRYGRFRRATDYYEAGVRFRRWDAAHGSQRPLLDVTFSDGVLRMPLQCVDEKTGYILHNVLAYEQKYYRSATSAGGSYVAAYLVFMSQLLSSPEDVALLSRRGVMEHLLGKDDDVCALFRGLADGLVFDPDAEH